MGAKLLAANGRVSDENDRMTTVLAADLGGSTVKAALVSRDGAILAHAALDAPAPDANGLVPPVGWWVAFRDVCAALKRENESAFTSVQAVAITGVTRTPVVLDESGSALIGAITARDARAQEMAARSAIDPEICPEAAHYDAFHPAARLKWIGEKMPHAIAMAVAVVDPKDFIAAQLTGRIASDPISAARLIAAARSADSPSLLERLELPGHLVPDLIAPGQTIGAVRLDLDEPFHLLAGRPVIMASHDTWCGVLGLGALTAGLAYNVSGTTETFGVLTAEPVKADGLIDLQWGDGLHQIGGPGQNGADILTWLGTIIGAQTPEEIPGCIARALAEPRQPTPLLFLPYLSGERVPFWDANLRAAFLGLSREHGRTDLVWAALEGIALLNRVVLGRAEAVAGITVGEVRLGGGAARSALWAQVKADVLERPVSTVTVDEPGVFGAALAGFVGLRTFETLAQAQQLLVRAARRFEPRPEKRDFYRALALLFYEAHDAVRPVSHRLTRLTAPPP
jgi:xylulokinase